MWHMDHSHINTIKLDVGGKVVESIYQLDLHAYSLLTYITCLAGYSFGTVKTNSRKYLRVESTII